MNICLGMTSLNENRKTDRSKKVNTIPSASQSVINLIRLLFPVYEFLNLKSLILTSDSHLLSQTTGNFRCFFIHFIIYRRNICYKRSTYNCFYQV